MSRNAIICVDDEVIILYSLVQELKMNLGDRYIYESAVNATEALQVIDNLVQEGVQVDLVISDWLMPGIKGDEFLVIVKNKYPGIRSILITGQADDAAMERASRDAGASAILRKPWNTAELIGAARECCEITPKDE
jgi:CheY-like chemotaxis protein